MKLVKYVFVSLCITIISMSVRCMKLNSLTNITNIKLILLPVGKVKANIVYIMSVCLSVRLSVCLSVCQQLKGGSVDMSCRVDHPISGCGYLAGDCMIFLLSQ